MKCPKCGCTNKKGAKFCTKCGEVLLENKLKKNAGGNKRVYVVCGATVLIVCIVGVILWSMFIKKPVDSSDPSTSEVVASSGLDSVAAFSETEKSDLEESDIAKEDVVPVEESNVSELRTEYCPKDTKCYYYNGHTYAQFDYTVQKLEKDYYAWEAYCEGFGGHLATITSAEENAAIYNMIQQEGLTLAFFGYSDEENEGDWKWITGERSDYTNWVEGQPNNGTHDKNRHPQNYAQFSKKTKDGQWNDADIGDSSYHFVCEWDTIIEQSNAAELTVEEESEDTETVTDSIVGFWGIWCSASKSEQVAEIAARKVREYGFDAQVFVTTDWENLNKEKYYVVTAGVYQSQEEAKAQLGTVQEEYPSAYIKYSGKEVD